MKAELQGSGSPVRSTLSAAISASQRSAEGEFEPLSFNATTRITFHHEHHDTIE